jgi:hypothetical protein
MNTRWILLAIASVLILVLAACEVDSDDDSVPAVEPEVEDVQTDDAADDQVAEESTATPEPDPTATPEPEPTPTPEPEPTPTPEPEEPEFGTRQDPIPIGKSAVIGDWEIRVIDTIPDATQAVLDENMFNDPPTEGHQFYIVRIEATYIADDSADFWWDVNLKAVDDGGVVYEGMDARCGVIPDNIRDRGEVFSGASIEGNVCWSVNSELTDSLLIFAEPLFSFTGERVFFSLNE